MGLFNNQHKQDPRATEKELRKAYPHLLHENEHIEHAFRDMGGKGRDRDYLTTHRILREDGKGIGHKRKNYRSIPYTSIQAFSIESAGKFDTDSELHVWAAGGLKVKIDFAPKTTNIFEIQQFLNTKVGFVDSKGQQDEIDAIPPNMDVEQSAFGNMMDWLGDNAKQIDAKELEQTLKTTQPVLLSNETVQIAFKSGRDTTCFTDKRVLLIDVQGLTGKKIEYKTVLWSSIHAFTVQTAGAYFDRDTEVMLHTNIIGWDTISQDLRNGKANLFALQKLLCNHVLGEDKEPLEDVDHRQGQADPLGNWWFRDNQRPLDAVEMDRVYHTDPAILQGSEMVEFAFKGRRDITMFTTKRLLIIDPQGIYGKKIAYTSVPWKSVIAFGVRTAGRFFDFDTEVFFSTEMAYYPGRAPSGGDNPDPGEPARPLWSQFEIDFNKNYVDMYKMKYYLSRRILLYNKMEIGAPIPLDALTTDSGPPTGFFDTLLGYVGNDQTEIDAVALNAALHDNTKILLDDEVCIMAFRAGRDMSLFTNLRVMLLDVQGLTGQKVQYTSVPLRTIRAFSFETAGLWDTDSELTLITRNRWHLNKLKFDFRTGKCDIVQVNKFLSALIVGLPSDPKVDLGNKNYAMSSGEVKTAGANSFWRGIQNNAEEIDAKAMDRTLRSNPPVLLEAERVVRAFQSGRDSYVYTNRRRIYIDAQGMSGKRVSYQSIPYKWIQVYEFETPGHLDNDAELYLYTDVCEVYWEDKPRRCSNYKGKNSILKKTTDIYEMGKLMNDYVLMDKYKTEGEPEIDLLADMFTKM